MSAAVVSVDGQPVKLQLCDTAGQVSRLYKHARTHAQAQRVAAFPVVFASSYFTTMTGYMLTNQDLYWVLKHGVWYK